MFKLMNLACGRAALALVMCLFFVSALPVAAAEIRIEGKCTMRKAIWAANHDRDRDGCPAGNGDDVIILTRDSSPGLGQMPEVTSRVVLEGGNHKLTIDNDHPIFRVNKGNFTVRNLEIVYDGTRKNKAFNNIDGRLTLINVTVTGCQRGVRQQEGGHTSISGNSNICDLAADDIVYGSGTSDVRLPAPTPVQTCAMLPGGVAVTATFGLASGVQCTRVGPAGIGIASVVSAGFIDAIDIWGYVEQGVEVCFPQVGSITFLDASVSPRAVTTVSSYARGSSTCARLTRAGTVVLAPGQPTSATPPVASPPAASQPTGGTGPAPAPAGCPIHTTGHLFLRADPSLQGTVLGAVPRGSNLTSPSRNTYWYQVTYNGLTGWIGHKYVRANC